MDGVRVIERMQRGIARLVPAKPFRLRNRRGVVTFTFDDFCVSAVEAAGSILARHGVRATYYVAGSWCGRSMNGVEYYSPRHLAAIHEAGHEVGCHTFSHLACQNVPHDVLMADWSENQR